MSSPKTRLLVLFGGRSGEHEVSLVSAGSVIGALDRERYEIIPLGITRRGKWLCHPEALELLKEGDERRLEELPAYGLDAPGASALVRLPGSGRVQAPERIPVDVALPVLHGPYGEDGTIQGALELAGIPYVGSGVLGSALSMDKIAMKLACSADGLPMIPFLWILRSELEAGPEPFLDRCEESLGYPVFVKPANLGSSVGISKAHDRRELAAALALAAEYDRRILVEQAVRHAREIEISLLGNDEPRVSVCGEILPSREFYDYEAKYVDGESRTEVPARLSPRQLEQIETIARRAHRLLDIAGMARADFLLEPGDSGRVFFNEINTIPGFTSISMYPRLWEASGLPYPRLLDELIRLARERHADRARNRTSVQTNDWYRSG
jgi:D-alanine-D-alanine ligase